jgi:hypothetical protein
LVRGNLQEGERARENQAKVGVGEKKRLGEGFFIYIWEK